MEVDESKDFKISLKNEKERLSDRINYHYRIISTLNREVESMILTMEILDKAIEIKREQDENSNN